MASGKAISAAMKVELLAALQEALEAHKALMLALETIYELLKLSE